MLRIIFMGTPDFALPALEAIRNSDHELIAVITQPDRPKGRGKLLTPPPVKVWAEKNQIPVYQPLRVRGNQIFMEQIRSLAPDLIVTAAYGQILPGEFLDIPPLGCINIHASMLPEYRGASPIQQVLLDGRDRTGISVIYMDIGMDTGDIIYAKELAINPDENAGQLHDRLAHLAGTMISEVLDMFEKGRPEGKPQNSEKATYCSKIEKTMGEIQWSKSAAEINNHIRALTPWPGAFTFVNGKRLKVWKASVREYSTNEKHDPGTVLCADRTNGLIVACGRGILRIKELQVPGGRPMSDLEYLRGNPVAVGIRLGH